MRAVGNIPCNRSSSFSEPLPRKYTYSLWHLGQTRGTGSWYPQKWQSMRWARR